MIAISSSGRLPSSLLADGRGDGVPGVEESRREERWKTGVGRRECDSDSSIGTIDCSLGRQNAKL